VEKATGIALRRKRTPRGFYHDPSPGIHGLREGFERAAKGQETKIAGQQSALKRFGLMKNRSNEDPVDVLTQLYKWDDFGLKRRNPGKGGDGRPTGFGALQGRSAGSTAQNAVPSMSGEANTGV